MYNLICNPIALSWTVLQYFNKNLWTYKRCIDEYERADMQITVFQNTLHQKILLKCMCVGKVIDG